MIILYKSNNIFKKLIFYKGDVTFSYLIIFLTGLSQAKHLEELNLDIS